MKQVYQLKCFDDGVKNIKYSIDGKNLIVGLDDKNIKIFET